MFTIFPAIDIRHGRCVRLRQGQDADITVYSDSPLDQAREFLAQGAQALHVVDLDGAFAGAPAHIPLLRDIAAALPIPVECGGGLRTDADVAALLAAGVFRTILGTRALEHPEDLAKLVARHGAEHIVAGIDARDGLVQTRGWTHTSSVRATDLAARAADAGVSAIIYTDTATDGMLSGPNLAALAQIADAVPPAVSIVASGGVSSPDDILAIRRLQRPNLTAAIVGKALYDRRTTLPDLLRAASAPL